MPATYDLVVRNLIIGIIISTHVLILQIPHDVSVVDRLAGVLSTLLTGSKGNVPLYAAVLLSHAHLERDACVERLKSFLQSHTPCHRSMVS